MAFVFVIIEGGMVEHIVTDSDVEVIVLDKDVENQNGVHNIGGDPTCVTYPYITVAPDTVRKWQKQIEEQNESLENISEITKEELLCQ